MKCFVISPIGQPGSASREHADDVYECIIRPALEEAKIEGHRADFVKDVGRITKQMYESILYSDFCIAVLHNFNPNVFYELAVAHSAGIPVILLSEKGIDPPFDLKDERLLHYDLGPRSIFRRENIGPLLTMIESVRRLKGARLVPFDPNLAPLNAGSADLPYSLKPETNADAKTWLDLVRSAQTRFFIAGIGFTGWRGIPGMKEALTAKVAHGCEIRVLTMDVENPSFGCMLNPDVTSAGSKYQGLNVSSARAWFQKALGETDDRVRALRGGMLFQQIIICDDRCLITPYLYSASTAFSPSLEIRESHRAFGAFLKEFEDLWDANPSDQNQKLRKEAIRNGRSPTISKTSVIKPRASRAASVKSIKPLVRS